MEAWTIVGESFVDPAFNNHNWEEELRTHMMAAYNSTDGDTAYQEINRMLEDLGDVYTRRIPPEYVLCGGGGRCESACCACCTSLGLAREPHRAVNVQLCRTAFPSSLSVQLADACTEKCVCMHAPCAGPTHTAKMCVRCNDPPPRKILQLPQRLPRPSPLATAQASQLHRAPLTLPCLPGPPLRSREYASFRVSSDGELQGVGMLIANEPVNGHLLVLAPIKGGPADRAGILPGDEVRRGASNALADGTSALRALCMALRALCTARPCAVFICPGIWPGGCTTRCTTAWHFWVAPSCVCMGLGMGLGMGLVCRQKRVRVRGTHIARTHRTLHLANGVTRGAAAASSKLGASKWLLLTTG